MTSLDFFFKTGSSLLLCQRPLFVGSRGCSSIPCVDFSLRGSSCCKARVLGHPGFQQLQSMNWVVVATGLTCSATCGIFRDRGSNPCPLLWYVGSYPLCHQASPSFDFLNPVISEPAAHSWFQVCVCVCVCVCVRARACTQSCLTLRSPGLSGSSVCGIFQARILEWVAVSSSRGSSQPRDGSCVACVCCITGRFVTHWAIWLRQ